MDVPKVPKVTTDSSQDNQGWINDMSRLLNNYNVCLASNTKVPEALLRAAVEENIATFVKLLKGAEAVGKL
jgi:hypothetical protein